ncbi:NADH-quinone oxidoreductase subunit NuoN [Microaerobacter geothermalis]|uniref:NADH-quinone oxidoreductase subunit NuoN n=1 Tax=Microaerobacter geothermalis TaxID=674972 RepID=UPI001F3BB5C4|nr:NADH-quinone oxidoreductase subunit NuoN [Microaerobacter geothermalis]MCF6093237.1 NADH-quinone oxidoreductase subunit NuoN [Microaerobacter geothermalis]
MNVLDHPWGILAPEFAILGVATLIMIIDLFMSDEQDRSIFGWMGIAGILLSIYFVFQNVGEPVQQIMNDMIRLDAFANIFKLLFLTGTALVLLITINYVDKKEIKYDGELYYLILTALLGAMIMASSADLITLFVGLELLSISSYIMAGLKKKHIQSNESAFKYVVTGGIASAILLYGMSFVYGLTGSTNLYVIADRLGEAYQGGFDLMVYLAFFLMFVGLTYKISAVPIHMWAPDVYQGAPTPITAFLASVSKAAGFAIVFRVFLTAFSSLVKFSPEGGMISVLFNQLPIYIGIVAAATMIIGNTLALRQTNVKRMMAYSGIGHAGYLLIPFATITNIFFEQALYYLIGYLFATVGAFAIIMVVNRDQGTEDMKSFAGLYHRAPLTAFAMTILLISMAGLPITAGFFGKFYIFLSSVLRGNYWLAGIMVATSVVSYFYYFGIIRQMYMRAGSDQPLKIPPTIATVVIIAVVVVITAGFVPNTVIDFLQVNFNLTEIFVR